MTVSEEAIEQEHRDFLRKIANEVYELVRDQTNMACFRSRVKLFCEKNEEHQREVKLLEKASSADSKLHKAIKKKEKEIWGKTWEEMTEEERNENLPYDIVSYTGELEGFEHYVHHEHLKDIDDNRNCRYNYCFWGPPAKTAGLLEFLTPPPTRNHNCGPSYWDFEFSPQPDDDEKTICCYALLVAVHDIKISEKPIFNAKIYNGAWELRNKWKNILWKECIGGTWSAVPSFRIEGLKDTRAWIQRALSEVKADLGRIGQAETNGNTHLVRDLSADIPEKDLRLFLAIGVDIKKHFDEYRDAGKWLDGYYDEARYWERTHSELERLRRVEAEGKNLTPEDELHKENLEQIIKEKRPPMLDHRLSGAWWALYKENRGLLGQEEAKAVLLIAWLATDVDADKADLNLTQFEKWPWKSFWEPIKDNDFRQSGRELLRELLWLGPDAYPREEYYKVECLQLVRAAWARREAEKYLTSKPAETEKESAKLKTVHKALIKALSTILKTGNTTEITRDALVRKTSYSVSSGNVNQAYKYLKTKGIITQDGQNFTPKFQQYKENPPD